MKQSRTAKFLQEYNDERGYIGPQWLNVEGAVYNLDGMPRITSEEEFGKTFDIKKDKCRVDFMDLPEWLDFERWQDGELRADELEITIGTRDDVYRVFRYKGGTEKGSMLVRTAYLEPFGDNMEILYTVRKSADGTPYLCVMDGVLLAAIIFPVNVAYERRLVLKNEIEQVVKELERSLAWDRVNANQK